MQTQITNNGSILRVTEDVFDDRFTRGGEWRTEVREYSRYIGSRGIGCRHHMSFPEWEQHFWRCPMCGEPN